MLPHFLSFAFLHCAVFCSFIVVEADIKCYECLWESQFFLPSCLSARQSDPACKSDPPSKYLENNPRDDFLTKRQHTSTNMKVNDTAQEITYSSPKKQQELEPQNKSTLCATIAYGQRINGYAIQALIRTRFSISNPEAYEGKCMNSFPPFMNRSFPSSGFEVYMSTFKGKNLCFCGTNGCNKDAIEIPSSGVKPTFSSLAALLSLFLLKYMTSTTCG